MITMCSRLKKYSLCAIVFALLFLVDGSVFSQNRKQLEKEKRKIENEIKTLNKNLSATRKGKKMSASQVKTLNKKIKKREQLIKNINSQLVILEDQISVANDSIELLKIH